MEREFNDTGKAGANPTLGGMTAGRSQSQFCSKPDHRPAMVCRKPLLYTCTAMEAYAAERMWRRRSSPGKRAGMERAAEELRQIYVVATLNT